MTAKNKNQVEEITALIEKLTEAQAKLKFALEENKKFYHHAKGLDKYNSELESDNQLAKEVIEKLVNDFNEEIVYILNNHLNLETSNSPDLAKRLERNPDLLKFHLFAHNYKKGKYGLDNDSKDAENTKELPPTFGETGLDKDIEDFYQPEINRLTSENKELNLKRQDLINELALKDKEKKIYQQRIKVLEDELIKADDKVEKVLAEKDNLAEQVQRLEQEKNQSELAGINNAKKVETLQKNITENIALANSLRQQLHDSDDA